MHTWRGLGVASVSVLAIALTWAPAGVAASPADTAATLAYLQAGHALDQAIVRNSAASQSAVASLTTQLGRECRGALRGAPGGEEEVGPSGPSDSPRARGERQRSALQRETIEDETAVTVHAALYQPDRAAVAAYAAEVAPLSWSDSQLTALVHFYTDRLEQLAAPAPDLCADIGSWRQSGYRVLSAASREFAAAHTASSSTVQPAGSLDALLKPSEGRRALALIRQAKALQGKVAEALEETSGEFSRLRRTLGLPEDQSEQREHEPVLGHGTTSAGESFTVRREKRGGRLQASCKDPLSVELQERSGQGSSEGSDVPVCLSALARRGTASSCGSNVESLETTVGPAVRAVRMKLSDGRTITSRVVRVPRKWGGPGGVYVQAVRGTSPYPVSLTELNAQGEVIAVVNVEGLHCRSEPSATGPTFVDLATASTPEGEQFTIQGFLVHFGHNQTTFGLSSLTVGIHESSELSTATQMKPKAFSWSLSTECSPHEFAIVYGILASPGSSVLARTAAGLVPLTEVAIAPELRSEGPLVYGVFSTLPTELVVLTANGSTLYFESLLAKGSEQSEFCSGYIEA
jgi:hypothetical protein